MRRREFLKASASLAAGTLRLFGSTSPSSCSIASTSVALFDVLTFDLPDGVTSVDIPFELLIDGTVSDNSPFDQASVDLNLNGLDTSSGPGTVHIATIIGHAYSRTLTVTDGEQVNVNVGINASIGAGGVFDLSHTGRLSVALPTGTTFKSASGVFLTDSGGVPEPASWALMIVGFGGVGAAIRRRHASRQVAA